MFQFPFQSSPCYSIGNSNVFSFLTGDALGHEGTVDLLYINNR